MPAFDTPMMPDPAVLFHSLRLARSPRIGPVTWQKMVSKFGSAEAALDALPEHAARRGNTSYRVADPGIVRQEIERALAGGARPLLIGQDEYPAALAELPDAPPVLWARGALELLKQPMIAIVGARNASALGERMARQLSEGLAEAGYVVVSGFARGIDRAAHFAALKYGTIAVLAGGLDVIYPPQNADLADAFVSEAGLMLSEEPFGVQPLARHFPKRNRIISGLSQATVLVEAAARSGSLITAGIALDQGREVMAVPGHPFDGRAEGCNRLIRDGAALVRFAGDILSALRAPDESKPDRKPLLPVDADTLRPCPQPMPSPAAQEVLGILSTTPVPVDTVLRHLGRPAQEGLALLTDLDLDGRIERHPGGLISAKAP